MFVEFNKPMLLGPQEEVMNLSYHKDSSDETAGSTTRCCAAIDKCYARCPGVQVGVRELKSGVIPESYAIQEL